MKITIKALVLFGLVADLIGSPMPLKRVTVVGTGYVGLVAGACFSSLGHCVQCIDNDSEKIDLLRRGVIPFFEAGLEGLVQKNIQEGRLSFTMDIDNAIETAEVIVIAVSTPMSDDGQADLTSVLDVVQRILPHLHNYKVICIKSTVPIGTADMIKRIIREHVDSSISFDVVSNPEFLKEGVAIKDFMCPNRIVIGADSERAFKVMQELYFHFYDTHAPFVYTDNTTAETIKYAANAFLASKISFVNEFSKLCEILGADISVVAYGMGLDERIGHHFLKPGPGFGGSCFPKDMQALLWQAKQAHIELQVVEAAWQANQEQPMHIISKLIHFLDNDLRNKNIAILGLAFKAYTDDVRCSPAIAIIKHLKNEKAVIKAYDPCAMITMKKNFPDLVYSSTAYEAIQDADAIIILTEWPEFEGLDFKKIKEIVRQPIIIDARNVLNTDVLKKLGFRYSNMGNAHIPMNIEIATYID